jgi:hypothetical protein
MDERTRRLSDLLREAAEVHHVVYRITDGADDDRASFYADWLIDHSELPDALGGAPTRSHLVHEPAASAIRWLALAIEVGLILACAVLAAAIDARPAALSGRRGHRPARAGDGRPQRHRETTGRSRPDNRRADDDDRRPGRV